MSVDRRTLRRRRLLEALVLALVGVFVFKHFVADVYRVDSGSMRPTLFGGRAAPGRPALDERVLVRFGQPELERFEPVVVQLDGAEPAVVKRIAGLPGERVSIQGGDLLIGGERLGPDDPRPTPVVVFDDERFDVAEVFTLRQAPDGPWSREADTWHLDAREIGRGSDAGMMLMQRLRDGHVDHDGQLVPGRLQANDAVLELELRLDELSRGAPARVRLHLLEEGDTFQAVFAQDAEGRLHARLTRRNATTLAREDERFDVLAAAPVDLQAGRWHRLRFANVDNHLALHVDGMRVLSTSYEKNEPHPARTDVGSKSIGPRVGFGGEACRLSARSIMVARDLVYGPAGEFGIGTAISLGPDEVFVLGDNSGDSNDSRQFGPVEIKRLVGRPVAVVWPLARMRSVEGAVAPGDE